MGGENGAGLHWPPQNSTARFFPFEVLYGLVPNLQVSIGTTLFTDPRQIEGQTKSGDMQLSGLYNFNQETLSLPALGLRVTVNAPTGTASSGVDVRVKGLVTKSF